MPTSLPRSFDPEAVRLTGYRGRVPGSGAFLTCSFCGKSQKQVKKLIAGPDVYICNGCISGAHAVIAEPGRAVRTPIATIQQVSDEAGTQQCSFCGKPRQQVAAMAATTDARICTECLELCDEIVEEDLGGKRD
jgi:ATP-dependent protease Clp ATPase subunit